ncbi:MAG: hypothetical protein HC820_05615, partial [Hydrococcus sp. RM1_1_31]|nr:hypothetical protein [Hydrococcus sp. RM1_1_31]
MRDKKASDSIAKHFEWERSDLMMRSHFPYLAILAALFCQPVSAQVSASISCETPLDAQWLEGKPQENIITAKTISQQGLTIPSLWWAQEQF